MSRAQEFIYFPHIHLYTCVYINIYMSVCLYKKKNFFMWKITKISVGGSTPKEIFLGRAWALEPPCSRRRCFQPKNIFQLLPPSLSVLIIFLIYSFFHHVPFFGVILLFFLPGFQFITSCVMLFMSIHWTWPCHCNVLLRIVFIMFVFTPVLPLTLFTSLLEKFHESVSKLYQNQCVLYWFRYKT